MRKIKSLKTFIESRGCVTAIVLLSLLQPFQLLTANEQEVLQENDDALIDRFIFNAGFSKAFIEKEDSNGGVSGVLTPEDVGVGVTVTASKDGMTGSTVITVLNKSVKNIQITSI